MPPAVSLLDALGQDNSPDRIRVNDGNNCLTGSELEQLSRAMAEKLVNHGGTRIALLAGNGMPWLLADIACQISQCPLLPLPPFFSPQQMVHALHESGIDLLLVANDIARNQGLIAQFGFIDFQQSDSDSHFLWLRRPLQGESQPALPEGTGKITFTSGSTGNPKGVCLSSEQLIKQASALAQKVGLSGHRHLCLLPLSILLENVAGVYCSLIAGGQVVMPDLFSIGFNGSSNVDINLLTTAISGIRPDSLILMPQLLSALVAAGRAGWQAPDSLRFVAVGGSRVSATTVAEARHQGLPVYEGYGLSECASVVSLNVPGADKPGTAGKPLDHLNVEVNNGEFIVSGNPCLGYVSDPASWHPDHIATGDLGAIDEDGFIQLQGRKKNLLISSYGRNISPEWIESELLANHGIEEAIVLGDNRPWLSALIRPAAGFTENDVQDWMNQVNGQLPDYARILGWHRVNTPLSDIEGLLTTNGKPRRDAIDVYFASEINLLYSKEQLFG